jgi:hypothetical protein
MGQNRIKHITALRGGNTMYQCHRLLIAFGLFASFGLLVDTPTSFGRGPGSRGGHGSQLSGGHVNGNKNLDALGKKRLNDGDQSLGNKLGGPQLNAPGNLQLPSSFQPGDNAARSLGGQLPDNLQQQAKQWRQQQSRLRGQQTGQSLWQQYGGQAGQNAQQHWNQFQSGPAPFSPEWYAEHPTAWQVTHPYADEAFVVSTAAVASWLGWAAYQQPVYGGSSTTVIYEQAAPAQEQDTAADPQPSVAAQASASNAPVDDADWLSLGVYDVVRFAEQPPLEQLQLAVDRQGNLRGVYYDAITNTTQNLVGTLDQRTGAATWRLESNGQLTFTAPLDELTQRQGTLTVRLPGGEQQWQLVRMENSGN